MPHAQARVAVLLDVIIGTAEPADEEQGEAVAALPADLAVLIAGVQPGERRLAAAHRVIEVLHDPPHHGLAAKELVRGLARVVHRPSPYLNPGARTTRHAAARRARDRGR